MRAQPNRRDLLTAPLVLVAGAMVLRTLRAALRTRPRPIAAS